MDDPLCISKGEEYKSVDSRRVQSVKKYLKPLREQLLLEKSNVSCKDLCHVVVVVVVVVVVSHPNSQFFEYGVRTLYCLSHRQLS